jgi:hypothetical protein
VIGYLSGRSPKDTAHLVAAFRKGLGESGLVEVQNLTIPKVSNFAEVAMPTETIPETARSSHTVRYKRLASIVPFLNQRLADA